MLRVMNRPLDDNNVNEDWMDELGPLRRQRHAPRLPVGFIFDNCSGFRFPSQRQQRRENFCFQRDAEPNFSRVMKGIEEEVGHALGLLHAAVHAGLRDRDELRLPQKTQLLAPFYPELYSQSSKIKTAPVVSLFCEKIAVKSQKNLFLYHAYSNLLFFLSID